MRLEFKLKKKRKNRWKLKFLFSLMVFFLLVGLYLSPVGQETVGVVKTVWNKITEKAHWQLSQVVVEGHKRSDRQTLINALKVYPGQDMNTISLKQAREDLLKLPWVKGVMIERHIPDTLVVHIIEKTPIALWQNNQTYQPLDEEGNPIKDDKLLPADLILVVGSDAPENTLSLLRALEKVPSINALVRSAVRVEKRRWNLYLMDAEAGLQILLPEKDFDAALRRLSIQNEKENLFEKNLQAIDVRLSDRIILHPKKTLVKKASQKRKNTK